MNNKFTTVAFDLDGTLLSSSKTIDDETMEFIKSLKRNNYIIILASGRHLHEMIHYSEILGMDSKDFLISCDGEYVHDGCGKILNKGPFLNVSDLSEIISNIKENITIVTNKENIIWAQSFYSRLKFFLLSIFFGYKIKYITNLNDRCLNGQEIEKVIVRNSKFENIVKLNKVLTCHYIESDRYEIMPYNTNKYSALLILCKFSGLDMEKLLYFGNDYNDLECFQNHMYCVAMEQSPDDIKKQAYYVTDSNDNQGVLKGLKHLLCL